MVFTDPVKIQSTAESISAITPPPGYDPTFAMFMMVMPEEEWSDGGQQAFKETLASME